MSLQLPDKLIQSLQFSAGFNADSFLLCHSQKNNQAIRYNPLKKYVHSDYYNPVDWCDNAFFVNSDKIFPLDPAWHAGAYYIQEPSSLILHALISSVKNNLSGLWLDLCAAPGGKTTLMASMLEKNNILIANEPIRGRLSALRENICKWGHPSVFDVSYDPSYFSITKNLFSLAVVDAPCSGSGLFRKNPDLAGQWSENEVAHCSLRQQRIVMHAIDAVKPGGYIIYSTCSFSPDENEEIAKYILKSGRVEQLQPDIPDKWGFVKSEYGYRSWPYLTRGEGFYIAMFQKTDDTEILSRAVLNKKRIQPPVVPMKSFSWLKNPENFIYTSIQNDLYIYPENLLFYWDDFLKLNKRPGKFIGTMKDKDFIPDHSLAMMQNEVISEYINEVDTQHALTYLRKGNFNPEIAPERYLVRWNGLNLGWIKKTQHRTNNNYPQEWRLRLT